MPEQTERFKGLRRIAQEQEGLRSPSYQVHAFSFDKTEFDAQGFCERKFEIEATDIIFPYHKEDFYNCATGPPPCPDPRMPDVIIEFYLNDSDQDLMSIDQWYVPVKDICNFPCYRITLRITAWPGEVNPHLPFKFYTLVDPRVIQALENK